MELRGKVSIKGSVNYAEKEKMDLGISLLCTENVIKHTNKIEISSTNLVLDCVLNISFYVSLFHLLHETLYAMHDGNFAYDDVPEIPCTWIKILYLDLWLGREVKESSKVSKEVNSEMEMHDWGNKIFGNYQDLVVCNLFGTIAVLLVNVNYLVYMDKIN